MGSRSSSCLASFNIDGEKQRCEVVSHVSAKDPPHIRRGKLALSEPFRNIDAVPPKQVVVTEVGERKLVLSLPVQRGDPVDIELHVAGVGAVPLRSIREAYKRYAA